MIARITGTLLELDSSKNSILLEVGDLAYELMVPGYAVSDLSENLHRDITLYCLEYYEGSSGGSTFIPRLVGFPQSSDKEFFQRFISVKGIGIRKALRALSRPLADIACGIEQGDTTLLKTLPEIGKRTAEQIIAELKGKMEDYASLSTHVGGKPQRPKTPIEQEALEILLQLGERRNEAELLIEKVMQNHNEIETTDSLVQAFYRVKTGTL